MDIASTSSACWLALASAGTTQPAAAGHGELAVDIGLAIVSATVLAYIARAIRQPLLLAYIAAGVVIGPKIGLGWVENVEAIETLARLGLAFLLFIVGLEIDLQKLLVVGRQAAAITLVQVAGSILLGAGAGALMATSGMGSLYIGVAVAFSSTMITVKLLSDRSELDTLPGRVTLGVLLLQDVLAIVVLAVQPSIGAGSLPLWQMALAIFNGLALVTGAVLVSRFVLPLLFRWVAMSPEVMLLSAITWCFVVCYAAMVLGFSEAMGALIAGVSIAQYPYTIDVVAKIRSLRDFFVTLFFVSLGLLMDMPTIGVAAAVVVLVVVVVLSRVLTVWPMVRVMGYDDRVGILSSIHLAQIGEFGLVVVLLGATKYNHIGSDLVSLIIILMVVTSTLSTYLMQFSHPLVRRIVAMWRRQGPQPAAAGESNGPLSPHGSTDTSSIMLVGCFRVGSSLVNELKRAGKSCSVIDFNPRIARPLTQLGARFIYGDISHLDTLDHSGVEHADVLVVPISDDFLRGTDNASLLQGLRQINPKARIILTAESVEEALHLYDLGADYVLLPRVLTAEHLATIIAEAQAADLRLRREEHRARLSERVEVL